MERRLTNERTLWSQLPHPSHWFFPSPSPLCSRISFILHLCALYWFDTLGSVSVARVRLSSKPSLLGLVSGFRCVTTVQLFPSKLEEVGLEVFLPWDSDFCLCACDGTENGKDKMFLLLRLSSAR